LPRVKRQGLEANYSVLSTANVKNEWNCTSACTWTNLSSFYNSVYVTECTVFLSKAGRVTVEPVASSKHELAQNDIPKSSRQFKFSHFSMLYRISSEYNFASGHNFVRDYWTSGVLSAHLASFGSIVFIATGKTNILTTLQARVTAIILRTY
jgi:hypothetical protein